MSGVLVTGFEPFGESAVNPSQQLVTALDGEVATAVLPVSYARADDALLAAIRAAEPDVVICFGLADERRAISIERFAHNLDEATTVDNEAAGGSGRAIDPAGPLAVASTLPVDEIVTALRTEDIPVEISRDAGGFLCNHVFYTLMQKLDDGRIGGFVHVPPLDVVPLDVLLRAARVIVTTCEQAGSGS